MQPYGGVKVKFQALLTLTLDSGDRSAAYHAALPPRK
jgi:hypothetical protein